jgi:hypothetical protein
MRIASDAPKEIIELLNLIDFDSPLTQNLLKDKKFIADGLKQLETQANKFLPLRKANGQKTRGLAPLLVYQIVDIPGCPEWFADFINKYDYSRLNFIEKKAAKILIKEWLKKKLSLKKGWR